MEKKRISEIKRIELPPERKAQVLGEELFNWWVTAVNAFANTVGSDKAAEILGPKMFERGKEVASRMVSTLKIEGHDAATLASLMNMYEDTMGVKGEVTEVGGDRVVRVNVSCPLSKCDPAICQLMECYGRGTAEVVAPEFTYKHLEMVTRGDPQCRWEVRRK
jgi:predicted ArsR family transcriptional regulator